MSDARWEQIKELFAAALERAPAERAAFVDQACAGDAELRREVESLLLARTQGVIRTGGAAGAIANASTVTRSDTPLSERAGAVIGPYKLLQQIGEGGFGTVFMAEQSQPVRRRVALKIIKLGMDTKAVVARFEAERQALALMDHPHIAKVLDGGATETGRPYFVMEYVTGDPITRFADAHRLGVRERLTLFAQVCAAVQHAHTKGVIHRDIKPANVLVTMSDGKPFAKVIDFGIAKATATPLTEKTLFTEHRQLIGTPEYMSPEQAEGSADIDTRTDVYALGVLLYELLTGLTPFDGARLRSAAFGEMQRILREEEPPMPSVRIERKLPAPVAEPKSARVAIPWPSSELRGELDWIVMKALDKDRARRYETPNQLADDVRRHLAGEAVVAAPPSRWYRLRKFVRRNKGPVGAGLAVAGALLFGVGIATWGLLRANARAAQLRDTLRYVTQSVIGMQEAVSGDTSALGTYTHYIDSPTDGIIGYKYSQRTGTDVPPAVVQPLPGQSEVEAIKGLVAVAVMTAEGEHESLVKQVDEAEWNAYTANLALAQASIAQGNWPEARARVMECVPGKRGWEWKFVDLWSRCTSLQFDGYAASFSPDGKRIVTAGSGTTAQVWDARSGQAIAELKGHTETVFSAAFSPDGTLVITASFDNTARVWDAATGAALFELKGHRQSVDSAAFSPDGRRIVTESRDNTTRVWDAATGASLSELKKCSRPVNSTVFNPDGTRIVIVSGDTAQVCDAATGALIVELNGHTGGIQSAAFSPDGTRIVTASCDGTARVWESTTGTSLAEFKGHSKCVNSAAFSPDGARVVTASDDRTARIWDAATGQSLVESEKEWDRVADAHFSSSGGLVVTASDNGIPRVIDAATGQCLTALYPFPSRSYSASFSPDGASILAKGDSFLRVWDAGEPDHLQRLAGPERFLGECTTSDLPYWSANDTTELRAAVIRGSAMVPNLDLAVQTPDGTRRIVADGARIRFLDPKHDDRLLAILGTEIPIRGLELASDGTRLLIHHIDGLIRVWDIRDPDERRKDLEREWAERGPAGEYLEGIWAGTTPTDKLRDAIVGDASLSALRRLVAVEMLDRRTWETDIEATQVFDRIKENQIDPAAVKAAARAANLPPRVKELVIAKADAWVPTQPK